MQVWKGVKVNKETPPRQMPMVDCQEIILRLHKEHFDFSLSEMGDACAQAQRELMVKEGWVRLPPKLELAQIITNCLQVHGYQLSGGDLVDLPYFLAEELIRSL